MRRGVIEFATEGMAEPTSASSGAADYRALLQQVPFLTQVPPDDLGPFAEAAVVRRYEDGDVVVEQGAFGHSMFVLVSGRLAIWATSDEGDHLELGELSTPGDFFGEVALLGRGVRSATVAARGATVLLEIEKNRFDRLTRRHGQAQSELEKFYHARSISTYTRLHRYIGLLDEATLASLTANATMRKLGRDDLACRQGDAADTVMLIKDGVLKATRRGKDGRLSILAYFNTDDIAGAHDPGQRPHDLIALGQCEIVEIPRSEFAKLEHSHPDVWSRFGKDDMHRKQAFESAGKTVMGAAAAFLQEGVEVESLLVINLDRCVRCGNCVRACHDRHEFTRLDRRGPIFRRRVAVQSNKHEHLLIPSSCRHCRDPECMIGCPTGAIQRSPDGDVDINDNCIGCDNCARKCPYGNITMRPLPEDQQKDGITKRAIKCNLCRGYEYSNCVYNCPRGAVLRVDPLRYFDELALVMEPEQIEAVEWQRNNAPESTKQRVKPRSTRFIWASLGVLAVALLGILGAYFASPQPRSGGTAWGLGFGVVSTACIAAAMFLGARKRMRNASLGHMEVWTQFHMVIGAVGFVAMLAHAGFQVNGVFTAVLLLVFALEILTGVAGQAIYMVVPRILTRLERGGLAKLIEDLLEEELALDKSIDELTRKASPDVKALFAGTIRKAAGSVGDRLKAGFDSEKLLAAASREVAEASTQIPEGSRATVDRLVSDQVRRQDVRAQIRLHGWLKLWLVVHLATAGALASFLLIHIVTMLLVIL